MEFSIQKVDGIFHPRMESGWNCGWKDGMDGTRMEFSIHWIENRMESCELVKMNSEIEEHMKFLKNSYLWQMAKKLFFVRELPGIRVAMRSGHLGILPGTK